MYVCVCVSFTCILMARYHTMCLYQCAFQNVENHSKMNWLLLLSLPFRVEHTACISNTTIVPPTDAVRFIQFFFLLICSDDNDDASFFVRGKYDLRFYSLIEYRNYVCSDFSVSLSFGAFFSLSEIGCALISITNRLFWARCTRHIITHKK